MRPQSTVFWQLRYPGLGTLQREEAQRCLQKHAQNALLPQSTTNEPCGMQTIVTEFSASPTDDARDLVNAAQVMLTGERQDVRNLCKPWGVHLTAQKSIAP